MEKPLLILIFSLFSFGGASTPLSVFVINDFSLAFVPQSVNYQSALASGPFVCPSSAYPSALSQFQFTSDVITGVRKGITMQIQYYAYTGGDGDPVPVGKNAVVSGREDFTENAIPSYTKFCADGPEDNDFARFIKLTITPAVKTDVLIIFTAASQAQVNPALPLISNNIKNVIVLGLNGTDATVAYPTTAANLKDFSRPDQVSCLINELNENLNGKVYDTNPVDTCYPQAITTPPPAPPMRILVINDFTTSYVADDYSRKIKMEQSNKTSQAISCPGGDKPEASAEFDFTNAIIQGVSENLEIYYYAYTGDNHAIDSFALTKEEFETKSEFRSVVCFDDAEQSNLQALVSGPLSNFAEEVDVLLWFTAADQAQIANAMPISLPLFKNVITVGLNGAVTRQAYPDSAVDIRDFSQPEVITCMIEAVYAGHSNPRELCGVRNPAMRLLVINDFTTAYLSEDGVKSRGSDKESQLISCPGGYRPDASAQFDYTNSIIQGADDAVEIYYYAYNGDGHEIAVDALDKTNFPTSTEFRSEVCFEDDPQPSDLVRLITGPLAKWSADIDTLLWFTAADQKQIANALPISMRNIRNVVTVGLKGADTSQAYPSSFLDISDFSNPQTLTCMLEQIYVGNANPRMYCMPQFTVLFVNDFTSDFVGDEFAAKEAPPVSKALYGMCPMNMYPQAGKEFNYTADTVNGLRYDADWWLMFYEYNGVDERMNSEIFTQEQFAVQASTVLSDACWEDHLPSNLNSLSQRLADVRADILVLFTASAATQRLPGLDDSFSRTIIVGLNGADCSSAYPNESISISDFSNPQVLSCMINMLIGDIKTDKMLSCVNAA